MLQPQWGERGDLTHTATKPLPLCWTPGVRVLIVAYGNPLRSDDGLAWRVADALEGKFSSRQVEILRLHQLMPELAESVGHFDAVIFVDAASADAGEHRPGEIRMEEIHAEKAGSSAQSRFSHHLTPSLVFALATQLYGAKARAFSATLTGKNFDHGESLSAAVHDSLHEFVTRIEVLARELQSTATGVHARSTKPLNEICTNPDQTP